MLKFKPYEIPNLEPRPDFWKVRPNEIIDVCKNVKRGRPEIIATTPGGFPVYAVFYGEFTEAPPQTNWYRRFRLGDYSVVESFACINNAVGDVSIGDHTRIGLHNTIIGPVVIGSHVNLAQGITITALNHIFSDPQKRIDEQGVSTDQVIIEDDTWIGANAVILPGVTIGRHSVIAAGAVVTKDIPPHSLAAGIPAKIIKQI